MLEDHDHLEVKEVEKREKKAGYQLKNNQEVITTLQVIAFIKLIVAKEKDNYKS